MKTARGPPPKSRARSTPRTLRKGASSPLASTLPERVVGVRGDSPECICVGQSIAHSGTYREWRRTEYFRSLTSVAPRTGSALRGGPPADRGDQRRVSRGVDRFVDHRRRGRRELGCALDPRVRGPDGPPFETASTVRAHVRQDRVDAVAAERALDRADHRVG